MRHNVEIVCVKIPIKGKKSEERNVILKTGKYSALLQVKQIEIVIPANYIFINLSKQKA